MTESERDRLADGLMDLLNAIDHMCDDYGAGLGDDHDPDDCKSCAERKDTATDTNENPPGGIQTGRV